MGRPVHRLRYLQAFLWVGAPATEFEGFSATSLASCGMILGVGIAAMAVRTSLWGLMLLAVALMIVALFSALKASRRQRVAGSAWSPEAHRAIEELRSHDSDGSLDERVDLKVGERLNRCCELWSSTKGLLQSAEWNGAEGTRLEAKTVAEAALEALMDDALVMALGGVRGKGQRRDVFAKRMANAEVVSPILESLEAVEDEMRRLDSEVRATTSVFGSGEAPVRRAIDRLAEIRQAEEELRDSIRS